MNQVRMKMPEQGPIIVTGCPRSGTSLICGIIERCGADGGIVCGPTKANPKGQYENTDVVSNCIKPFLKEMGADPRGQYPLPAVEDVPEDERLGQCISNRMMKQGVDTTGSWYFKSCKGVLIWPAMAAGFPNARWVIVRRNKDDIAASCLRTSFMNTYTTKESWKQWADYHIERFKEIRQTQKAIEIWPEQIKDGNLLIVKDMIRWLDLQWNEKDVCDFIDMDLYKGASA